MPQSLQCPRCNEAVSVPDQAAGQRVKCPHCEETFLAPGVASTVNDDDDWLKLDDDPLPPTSAPTPAAQSPAVAQPPASAQPPAPAQPTASAPKKAFTPDEEALLAEFTDDLDEFTAEIETPPPPHPSTQAAQPAGPVGPPRPASGGPAAGVGAAAPKPTSKPAPQADVVEYATEYRVTCNICGSMLYAKASQAGQTIKCSDCYSPVTVPPPPRVRKKANIDMDEASTFSFRPSETTERRSDPFQKSAEQLLNEASRVEDTSSVDRFDDTPSVREWAKSVFGIFTDRGVLAHWIGLSVLGSVPAMIALSADVPVLITGLFPAGFFLAVLTVICGTAILCAAANQQQSVSQWPTLDPTGWIGKLFIVLTAACLAAVPAWAACQIILGTQMLTVATTMLSIFAIFPFMLLSMLDMNTPLIPFSAEVARSVNKCDEAWGGFYFSSGLMFVALFMTFATAKAMLSLPVATAVIVTAAVGATFIYFSMLGRLAYAIGQTVQAPK